MKPTRVNESSGQYQNLPAVIGSNKEGVSRRGFIAATGMGWTGGGRSITCNGSKGC